MKKEIYEHLIEIEKKAIEACKERIRLHTEEYIKENAIQEVKAFCQYCEERQIKPKRFEWSEVINDFYNETSKA